MMRTISFLRRTSEVFSMHCGGNAYPKKRSVKYALASMHLFSPAVRYIARRVNKDSHLVTK